jgi:hypothetical protein
VKERFVAPSRYLPGGTEENHLSQDGGCPGSNMNPEPAEYEAGVLTTRPRRSVLHLSG